MTIPVLYRRRLKGYIKSAATPRTPDFGIWVIQKNDVFSLRLSLCFSLSIISKVYGKTRIFWWHDVLAPLRRVSTWYDRYPKSHSKSGEHDSWTQWVDAVAAPVLCGNCNHHWLYRKSDRDFCRHLPGRGRTANPVEPRTGFAWGSGFFDRSTDHRGPQRKPGGYFSGSKTIMWLFLHVDIDANGREHSHVPFQAKFTDFLLSKT